MPRQVSPHWGEDGFDDVEPVELSEAEARDLAAKLGFADDAPEVSRIQKDVSYIGSTFKRWFGRGASAFTRAEARKGLEELLNVDRIDYAALVSLNERALGCLHDEMTMMKPSPIPHGDSILFASMEDRLEDRTIRIAVRTALKRLKERKGPDRDGDIAWAVGELCKVYEDLTGLQATHSNKDTGKAAHLGYLSASQSAAGRFVQACFELINPNILESQLSHGMRDYIRRRNKPPKNQS